MTEEAKNARRERMAARKAAQTERDAQEKADKALVLDALRAVLKDPEATSAQRIYAAAVLENMMYYHFAPHNVKFPGVDGDADIAAFAKELETYQEKDE